MKLDFEIEKIKNSSNPKIRKIELLKLLQYYFNNGRPKSFIKYENELKDFIPDIMKEMTFEELMQVIPNYYQFCYTVTIDENFLANQNKISQNLLMPFSKILTNAIHKLNMSPLSYDIIDDRYVIICRHALTKGMYAPGSAIYSITSGLLNIGKKVVLVTLGGLDQQFINLKEKSKYLTIYRKEFISGSATQLINLRKICYNFRPTKIITEMPVNIGTALYFSKITSKILYWSPGFLQVPWFDKVLLAAELYDESLSKNDKFVEVPKSLNFELINPKIDNNIIKNFKRKHFIFETSFVMGTFSRYEKISEGFLEMVSNLLENNKNRKVIIAGTNDRSKANKILKKFINNNQAIVMGFSDVHILGNCCDVFIDTFPFPCGFSAIEIMAKGKPTLTINNPNLHNYKKSRIDELIFDNENKLNEGLIELENNSKFYNEMSKKSVKIAQNYDNSEKLAEVIVSL
jgi:hypothetical protein